MVQLQLQVPARLWQNHPGQRIDGGFIDPCGGRVNSKVYKVPSCRAAQSEKVSVKM